ncbi:MAG: S-layer homology domain-containing protein [Clostridia bacterium]|nr:S-layer homology domain-containing protein [Clostridia bacterium]
MKRLLFFIFLSAIAVVLCFNTFAAQPEYMPYFWKYTGAASEGDPDAILKAVNDLDAVLPNPSNVDEHNKMIWAVFKAAPICEEKGDYDKALYYYEKFVKYATYLMENDGQDFAENIKLTQAIIRHLSQTPEVYVACDEPYDVPYYGAKHEQPYGTFFGKCAEFEEGYETGHLIYVQFFNETISSFHYLFPSEPVYTMVAWNVPNENKSDLDKVNSGSWDDYIISDLKFLSTLEHKILLRFGAEVNCWDIPADKAQRDELIESYKNAFRRISSLAKEYTPNVAMVYSPNDVSNMYVTPEDFYPGDDYVDWVGMSSYCVLSNEASGKTGDRVDALYFRGLFDNPVAKIREVVDAFGDRKPILISECGFAYAPEEGQNTQHATEKLREFYTYVNMVYPQVKGVLYFNANFERRYKLSECPELLDTFRNTIRENAGMQAMVNGEQKGYTRFSTYEGNAKTIDLYARAAYPSNEPVSVSYSVDGNGVANAPTFPYKATLDISALSQGKHVLTLAVSCGNYYKTFEYPFYVGENNTVSQKEIKPFKLPFNDVSESDWFYNDVKTAYLNGLINGKDNGNYCPEDNMTYAEAVKLASCMHQLYYEKAVTLSNGTVNWYDTYAEYAKNVGILSPSCDFDKIADTKISRKEFVSVFFPALPAAEYAVINNIGDNAIPDVTSDNMYAPCVYAFYRAGILTGSDGGYFNPESNIKRSEVAAILTRMFDPSARKNITLS